MNSLENRFPYLARFGLDHMMFYVDLGKKKEDIFKQMAYHVETQLVNGVLGEVEKLLKFKNIPYEELSDLLCFHFYTEDQCVMFFDELLAEVRLHKQVLSVDPQERANWNIFRGHDRCIDKGSENAPIRFSEQQIAPSVDRQSDTPEVEM